MAKETLEARFWRKVSKGRKCWLWQAGRNSKGYGVFAVAHGKFVYAHRFAWEQIKGSIPEGLQVHHKCDVPLCVKPAHLWLGTKLDNMLDAQAKGRRLCSARKKPWLPKTGFKRTVGIRLLKKLNSFRPRAGGKRSSDFKR